MADARSTGATSLLVPVLAIYTSVRILEVLTGAPQTIIVTLEVLSALAFALVDGARHYGWRGVFVFAGICAIIGNIIENIGIATGFPFGHYEFLDLMGPRLLHVPVLLGLAYIGMAYVSWMVARIILGPSGSPRIALPLLASFIMTTWDWAQDPVWSTLLHAWKWRDGGPWFGVPLSNYFGWFLTVSIIYFGFAFYLRKWPTPVGLSDRATFWPALWFYAVCGAGNALQVFTKLPEQTTIDATGKTWRVADILAASALVSIFVMGGFVLAAVLWLYRRGRSSRRASANMRP